MGSYNLINLKNCPGIFIPCENLEALKTLIRLLYEKKILQGETFQLKNVPDNFLKELNLKY
jgi:hypothetical protein